MKATHQLKLLQQAADSLKLAHERFSLIGFGRLLHSHVHLLLADISAYVPLTKFTDSMAAKASTSQAFLVFALS